MKKQIIILYLIFIFSISISAKHDDLSLQEIDSSSKQKNTQKITSLLLANQTQVDIDAQIECDENNNINYFFKLLEGAMHDTGEFIHGKVCSDDISCSCFNDNIFLGDKIFHTKQERDSKYVTSFKKIYSLYVLNRMKEYQKNVKRLSRLTSYLNFNDHFFKADYGSVGSCSIYKMREWAEKSLLDKGSRVTCPKPLRDKLLLGMIGLKPNVSINKMPGKNNSEKIINSFFNKEEVNDVNQNALKGMFSPLIEGELIIGEKADGSIQAGSQAERKTFENMVILKNLLEEYNSYVNSNGELTTKRIASIKKMISKIKNTLLYNPVFSNYDSSTNQYSLISSVAKKNHHKTNLSAAEKKSNKSVFSEVEGLLLSLNKNLPSVGNDLAKSLKSVASDAVRKSTHKVCAIQDVNFFEKVCNAQMLNTFRTDLMNPNSKLIRNDYLKEDEYKELLLGSRIFACNFDDQNKAESNMSQGNALTSNSSQASINSFDKNNIDEKSSTDMINKMFSESSRIRKEESSGYVNNSTKRDEKQDGQSLSGPVALTSREKEEIEIEKRSAILSREQAQQQNLSADKVAQYDYVEESGVKESTVPVEENFERAVADKTLDTSGNNAFDAISPEQAEDVSPIKQSGGGQSQSFVKNYNSASNKINANSAARKDNKSDKVRSNKRISRLESDIKGIEASKYNDKMTPVDRMKINGLKEELATEKKKSLALEKQAAKLAAEKEALEREKNNLPPADKIAPAGDQEKVYKPTGKVSSKTLRSGVSGSSKKSSRPVPVRARDGGGTAVVINPSDAQSSAINQIKQQRIESEGSFPYAVSSRPVGVSAIQHTLTKALGSYPQEYVVLTAKEGSSLSKNHRAQMAEGKTIFIMDADGGYISLAYELDSDGNVVMDGNEPRMVSTNYTFDELQIMLDEKQKTQKNSLFLLNKGVDERGSRINYLEEFDSLIKNVQKKN